MTKQRRPIALYVITGLLSLTFLMTGASKLGSMPPSPENFARWGLSPTFMYTIGAVEVLGALALWVPRLSAFAALGLAATMLGALRTGIVFHEPLHVFLPLGLLALLLVLVYFRRRQITALFSRQKSPGS